MKSTPAPYWPVGDQSLWTRLGAVALCTLPLVACGQSKSGAPQEPLVVSFTLVDASTGTPIPSFDPVQDGVTLNLAALPSEDLNVRANTSPQRVGSVRFDFGGDHHVDNESPYTFVPTANWSPPLGSHRLTATAYLHKGARGAAGAALELSFNVVNEPGAPAENPLVNGNSPTLLESYYVWQYAKTWQRATLGMRYRPRQFGAAPYNGWDVLELPSDNVFRSYNRRDWLYINLNRPATLAVLWRGRKPGTWLSGWVEGPRLTGNRTFMKAFPAGLVTLGAIEGWENEAYTVLFAETDGSPSTTPSAPTGLEQPRPNSSCPAWVHDQYMAEGHDGNMYRSWHPQIDPVYWCYFGHSHGSDPVQFAGDVNVTFDYYADKGHRHEPHEGFKVFVVNTETHSMMFTAHLGSSEAGRICARIHSYDVALADRRTGGVLADLRLKGDFGYTMVVDKGAVFYRLKSRDCPEMVNLPKSTVGRVRIPLVETSGYEPWNASVQGNVLGISNLPALVIDNSITNIEVVRHPDGTIRVDDRGFAEYVGVEYTGQAGDRHWMRVFSGEEGQGFTVSASRSAVTGEFYTDYRGLIQLDRNDPRAVRQFIKPGLEFSYRNDNIIFTQDAWRNAFEVAEADLLRVDMNLEGGLTSPN